MSDYVNDMSTLQLWIAGNLVSLVLWLGIVLPLGYRLLLVPWGLAPFWTRMAEDKAAAVMLVLLLSVLGAATVYIGVVGLVFVLMVAIFKAIFLVARIALPRREGHSSPR